MKTFDQLVPEQQVVVYNNAFTFLHDHADYVHNLFDRHTPNVEPSGLDMFYPELWKGIHWAWFLSTEANWLIREKLVEGVKYA
jgi:hypothetical protein